MFRNTNWRRLVQICLGGIWLFDGILQFTPRMLSSDFVNQIVSPVAQNQPGIVAWPVNEAAKLMLTHPAFFSGLIGLIQIVLGWMILSKKFTKLGLSLSIAWALSVWFIGEGFGGIASLHMMLFSGGPGAALIYGLIALGVLPKSKAADGRLPNQWLNFVWFAVWSLGAIFQLLAGQNSSAALYNVISNNLQQSPGWLTNIDVHVLNLINARSGWIIIVLVIAQFYVALGALVAGVGRYVVIISGLLLNLIFWGVGQNFGNIFSGLSTDPNTGVIILLLGLSILPLKGFDYYKFIEEVRYGFKRLEKILV